MTTPLVSASWLNAHLTDEDLIILDATQSTDKVSAEIDTEKQINGARFFDLKNKFSDRSSDYPNMMPNEKQFEEACRKLGINSTSKIVVYDQVGIYFGPRIWWMFKTMGHSNVAVLDGGFPAWLPEDYPIENKGKKTYSSGNFTAHFDAQKIKHYEHILSNVESQNFNVIDARSTGRFEGTSPEPRKGLPSGKIPNSQNLPYSEVLENGRFKSPEEIKKIMNGLKLNQKPFTFTCGSGLTACIILLAFELVTDSQKFLYDGSWTEWAQRYPNV